MPFQNISNALKPYCDKWDLRFISIAKEVQSWSKDPSTKCGCVLVKDRRIISTGYNGLPTNLSDSLARYEDREFKLATIIHAEKNAIFNAAKNGATTGGATAYVTWPPCSQCASALIQAGVSIVVCPNPKFGPERWVSNFILANELLCEAGVKVIYFEEFDQCQTKTAQFVEPTGSTDSFTGLPERQAMSWTSMHSFAADWLRKRLGNA